MAPKVRTFNHMISGDVRSSFINSSTGGFFAGAHLAVSRDPVSHGPRRLRTEQLTQQQQQQPWVTSEGLTRQLGRERW